MESATRLGEAHWIRPVGIARTEAYWLEGRTGCGHLGTGSGPFSLGRCCCCDAACGCGRCNCGRSLLDGSVDAAPNWDMLNAVDIEPFASQLAGDWRAGCRCSGIGWAVPIKPHWRCWTPKRRPIFESR